MIVQLAVIGLVTLMAARLLGWRGPGKAALLMATLFTNTGNTGLAIALFAFGQTGLAIAGGWFAISTVTTHTLGVFIAARARAAAARLTRTPISYAIIAGVTVKAVELPLPAPLEKASCRRAPSCLAPRSPARSACSLAPPVAWLTGRLIGLEGVALAVAILVA